MIGKADFREAGRDSVAGVIHRLARRVAAERRVHVVIGGQRHGGQFQVSSFKFQVPNPQNRRRRSGNDSPRNTPKTRNKKE
jgi:hypothetical protein